MDELERKGGLSANVGIRYQTYYAIYRFLSADTTEIILEWLDEDLVIINEEITRPSMEFIQCKYITDGPLHFNIFYNDILRKFILIYERYSTDRPAEEIYIFSLVTNKGFDRDLDRFSKIPERLRDGTPPEGIERLFGRTLLRKIRSRDFIKEKPSFNLFYLFQFLQFFPNRTEKWLKDEIRKLLISFGSTNPDTDIAKILQYFLDLGSGKITKNRLRTKLKLDYPLIKQNEETHAPFKLDLKPENVDNIRSQHSETISALEDIKNSIPQLQKGITFAEMSTDQLYHKVNNYPIGTSERRHVERAAEDAAETTEDTRATIKALETNVYTIQMKFAQLYGIRKAHDIDLEE